MQAQQYVLSMFFLLMRDSGVANFTEITHKAWQEPLAVVSALRMHEKLHSSVSSGQGCKNYNQEINKAVETSHVHHRDTVSEGIALAMFSGIRVSLKGLHFYFYP